MKVKKQKTKIINHKKTVKHKTYKIRIITIKKQQQQK